MSVTDLKSSILRQQFVLHLRQVVGPVRPLLMEPLLCDLQTLLQGLDLVHKGHRQQEGESGGKREGERESERKNITRVVKEINVVKREKLEKELGAVGKKRNKNLNYNFIQFTSHRYVNILVKHIY